MAEWDWSSLFGNLDMYGSGPGQLNEGMGGGVFGQLPVGFNDRFDAAFPQMQPQRPLGPTPMQSPISPEALASSAAARGMPPPPMDLAPMRMPSPEAVQAWRDGVDATKPGAVGAALTGKTVGEPMDIRPPIQAQQQDAPTDVSAAKKDGKLDKFAEALKGVKAPAGPELQKLGTPAVPRPYTQIKAGDLMALLQTINAGQQGGSYNLPSTLGAALRK